MLSRTAEYALRAVLLLARAERDRPITAAQIARAVGAPANYLSKTLHRLVGEGLVEGTRGPHGGYRLRVSPERLTVVEVVEPFQEGANRGICLLGGKPCSRENPCGVHHKWRAVTRAMSEPLATTTIADLLGDTTEPFTPDRGSSRASRVVRPFGSSSTPNEIHRR